VRTDGGVEGHRFRVQPDLTHRENPFEGRSVESDRRGKDFAYGLTGQLVVTHTRRLARGAE
jgi:hypothetical protein